MARRVVSGGSAFIALDINQGSIDHGTLQDVFHVIVPWLAIEPLTEKVELNIKMINRQVIQLQHYNISIIQVM